MSAGVPAAFTFRPGADPGTSARQSRAAQPPDQPDGLGPERVLLPATSNSPFQNARGIAHLHDWSEVKRREAEKLMSEALAHTRP